MANKDLYKQWKADEAAHFEGWDFSYRPSKNIDSGGEFPKPSNRWSQGGKNRGFGLSKGSAG